MSPFGKGLRRYILFIVILIFICILCAFILSSVSTDVIDQTDPITLEIHKETHPNSYNAYSCIVLHKFHNLTDFSKEQITLASSELQKDDRCYYIVLYWIDSTEYSLKHKEDIQWLEQHENLDSFNYFIVDIPNTQQTFPNFFEFMDVSNYDWLQRDTWPWQMADIPEMVWYNTYESNLNIGNVKIWQLEYDVGWKGNLADLYEALEQEYSASHSEECGIMAYDCIDKKPKWTHHYKHTEAYKYNESAVEKEPVSCLIQMIRYTPKILRMMIDEINENKIVYCEIRAAMICQRNEWCKICDLYRPKNKYFGTFYSGTSFNSEQWKEILDDDSIQMSFWHRINTLLTH